MGLYERCGGYTYRNDNTPLCPTCIGGERERQRRQEVVGKKVTPIFYKCSNQGCHNLVTNSGATCQCCRTQEGRW